MRVRVIFALPSLVSLPWCPGQLPQSPTPQSTTDKKWYTRNLIGTKLNDLDLCLEVICHSVGHISALAEFLVCYSAAYTS